MSVEVVKTIHFKTFEDFWNQVSPLGELGKKLSGFVYRGEFSSKNKLLPTTLRDNYVLNDEASQVHHEIDLLCSFYKEANNNGLRVPNNKILHGAKPEFIMGYGLYWISDDFEETAALAQHYGMPTRLLDWTKDVFASFYFASKDILSESKIIKNDDSIVIYSLNFDLLLYHISLWRFRQNDITVYPKPLPLKFIVPYYSGIPNAVAQVGVFSYSEINLSPVDEKSWIIDKTPLDEKLNLLSKEKDSYYEFPDNMILLYKFILPKSEAIKMFAFISELGYSYSKLFPGYNSIIKTMEERRLMKEILQWSKT